MADQGNGTYIWDVEEQEWKNLGNVIGAQGPKGDTGNQGPQGPAGVDGATGATGPQGPQGPKGDKGDQGDQGVAGPQGIPGEDGAQGIQGPAGPQGIQGPKGDTGAIGPTGLQGPVGPQGLTGPQGPAGSDGAQGPQGVTGPQGPAGANGADGERGSKILLYYDYDMDQPSWYNTGIIIESRILDTDGTPARNIKPNDWVISGKFRYLIRLCERQQTTVGGVLTWVWTSTSDDRIPLPQGPTGNVNSIAWKVNYWSEGKYPASSAFNNVYILGGLDGPAYQTPTAGQFFFTRTDNILGFIGGVYDDSDPNDILYYAYQVDCVIIHAASGLNGRSISGTNAAFTPDNTPASYAYSTYLGGTPHVGDIVYNNDNSYVGTITTVDDTNHTYTVGNVNSALIRGADGARGATGATGAKGDKGDRGEKGAMIRYTTLQIIETTGGRGTTTAQGNWNVGDVVISSHSSSNGLSGIIESISGTTANLYNIMSLIGPQGPRGVQGSTGLQGPRGYDWLSTSVNLDAVGTSITTTKGRIISNLTGAISTNDLVISTVSNYGWGRITTISGDDVTIYINGTFKGAKGDTGPQGPQGPQGPAGPSGAAPDMRDYYTREEVNALLYNLKGGGGRWRVIDLIYHRIESNRLWYQDGLNSPFATPNEHLVLPPKTPAPDYANKKCYILPYYLNVILDNPENLDYTAKFPWNKTHVNMKHWSEQNIDYAQIRQYSETADKRGVWTGAYWARFNGSGGLNYDAPLWCKLINYDKEKYSHFGSGQYAKGFKVEIKYAIVADMNS